MLSGWGLGFRVKLSAWTMMFLNVKRWYITHQQNKMNNIVTPTCLYVHSQWGKELYANTGQWIKLVDFLPVFYKNFKKKFYSSWQNRHEKKRKFDEARNLKALQKWAKNLECYDKTKKFLESEGMDMLGSHTRHITSGACKEQGG